MQKSSSVTSIPFVDANNRVPNNRDHETARFSDSLDASIDVFGPFHDAPSLATQTVPLRALRNATNSYASSFRTSASTFSSPLATTVLASASSLTPSGVSSVSPGTSSEDFMTKS